MTFIRLILSLILLGITFGKRSTLDDSSFFLGMCILLSSWIFGSSVENIGDTMRKIKNRIDSFIEELAKVLKERSEIEKDLNTKKDMEDISDIERII